MAETLTFSATHEYDTRKPGITVRAELRSGNKLTEIIAKVDTGATHCIFQRVYGELLGLDIESGQPLDFSTATGSFMAYGHEVLLVVLGIEVSATVYLAAHPQFDRNVLGRQGWLDRVRLGLVDYEGRLYLSAHDITN